MYVHDELLNQRTLIEFSVTCFRSVDNKEDGGSVEGMKNGENSRSMANDVEMIMSQMHDLSFMLESNLSVPQKTGPFSPFPKD